MICGCRGLALTAAIVCGTIAAAASQAEKRSVRDGVYTEEQARRGEKIYGEQCAACHGTDLAGVTPFPALTGSTFVRNWDGSTLDTIVDRLQKTMPPDDPTKMTRQQHVDVLAYLLKMNGHPAGAAELPQDARTLTSIRFEPPTSKK